MTEAAPSRRVAVLGPRFLALLRPVLPILLALLIGGIILAALGRDPFAFYGNVIRRTVLSPSGLQECWC